MGDDAFTLARAKRVLPLLPSLFAAAKASDLAKLIDAANTIFDADQDAMGAFEDAARESICASSL